MRIHIAYLIAVLSTTAFFSLWFLVARKELRIKRSMLHSAQGQLLASQEHFAQMQDDPDAKGVMKRSQDIYCQSLEIYNQTLAKPWIFIPGMLMGFRKAVTEDLAYGTRL